MVHPHHVARSAPQASMPTPHVEVVEEVTANGSRMLVATG
jgi:hypothetical protein